MYPFNDVFTAIESNSAGRIWDLFHSLNEYYAIAAATSLGHTRLRELLYKTTFQFSARSPASESRASRFALGSGNTTAYKIATTPVQLLPVVLAVAFQDRTFIGTNTDQALATRVMATLRQLHAERASKPLVKLFRDVTHTLPGPSSCPAPLSEADFEASAKRLNVEVAAVKAVAEVETAGNAFDSQYRPVILFEAHKFHKFTKARYDLTHPHLSCASSSTSELYYKKQWHQYSRLYEAMVLDALAAVKAASWGKFQVMGFNHNGWPDPISFAKAMQVSEQNQLKSFEDYCISRGVVKHMKTPDWAKVANAYNGSDYAKNKYDVKMAAAYKKYGGK
jgi:N-acetylmuramidase